MSSPRRLIVHWFRRDLRIYDNTALFHAAKDGDAVLPVYILSDWKKSHHWTGPKRQEFLCDCLGQLAESLKKIEGRLVFRSGDAVKELRKLLEETKADALYFNRTPDPFGRETEEKVEKLCKELEIECRGFHDFTVHATAEVVTKSGKSYKVFTPYSKNWLSLAKPEVLPRAGNLNTPNSTASEKPPTLALWGLHKDDAVILEAGEKAARARLREFVTSGIASYQENRDLPAQQGTSRLSQDLRFGLISPRTAFYEAENAKKAHRSEKAHKNIDIFIKELAWREFYMALLEEHPEVLRQEFNPDWRGLPWDEPGKLFEAWKEGRTGFPIVDAGIRELLATGFMHNRVRMIVAMFLTKDLHLDWRLGEQFFMQHLVDGEIASNNGGWQWSAGTGADAAPYFRIQNPWSQTKRYDPQGEYIKRWVPELKDVPPKKFLTPPPAGESLAKDYPPPCVDHSRERAKTLAIFKKHRAKKP